jgi:hypothetical protein
MNKRALTFADIDAEEAQTQAPSSAVHLKKPDGIRRPAGLPVVMIALLSDIPG